MFFGFVFIFHNLFRHVCIGIVPATCMPTPYSLHWCTVYRLHFRWKYAVCTGEENHMYHRPLCTIWYNLVTITIPHGVCLESVESHVNGDFRPISNNDVFVPNGLITKLCTIHWNYKCTIQIHVTDLTVCQYFCKRCLFYNHQPDTPKISSK